MPSRESLDILACPTCKIPLERLAEPPSLTCRQCGLRFPLRDGIPVMLAEEAQQVS